jgi:hypothetical protein
MGSFENPTCSTLSIVIMQRLKGRELRAGQTLEALTPKAGSVFALLSYYIVDELDKPGSILIALYFYRNSLIWPEMLAVEYS